MAQMLQILRKATCLMYITFSVYAEKFSQEEFAIVHEVIDFAKQHSVRNDVKDSDITTGILKGALSAIDSHSTYYNKQEYEKLTESISGSFSGIGVYIEMQEGLVYVLGAIKGMPAEKSGVKNGDIITHIDGKSVFGFSLEDASRMLRGKKGSAVNVTVVRKNEKEPMKFVIKRDNIAVPSVAMEVLDDMLIISISHFNEQLFPEFVKLFEKQQNYKGIILDLRNNPGGVLDGAIALSSFFLPNGSNIVQVSNVDDMKKEDDTMCIGFKKHCRNVKYIANGDKITIVNNQQPETSLPLVILVNEYSASASEIVALAIQENKRGMIVGKKTFGKGSVQTVIPLKNGEKGAIKLTTALYYSPNGNSIQANGVNPDILLSNFTIQKQKELDSFLPKKETENKNYIKPEKEMAHQEVKTKVSDIEDFAMQVGISTLKLMIIHSKYELYNR